jgi:hypothetical protein
MDKYDVKDTFKQIPVIKKTGRAMPEHIKLVFEEILQKEYKNEYGDYIVMKILRNACQFWDMKYQYMFEYFKKDFAAYKPDIEKHFKSKPYSHPDALLASRSGQPNQRQEI